jgi:ribosomal protein S18 acetylase RimI-like enzyme
MTDERCDEVDAWCHEHGVACVFFLAEDRPESTLAAERSGFFHTDVRLTLSQSLPRARDRMSTPRIREAQASDLEDLRSIARVSHQITRFYHDPHFPDERCGDLYAEWIASSFNGGADAVLVADLDGRAVGYLTCEVKGTVGRLGLLGVAPAVRGGGLGGQLVTAALERFEDAGLAESALATQAQNIKALRLFTRAGYAVESMQLWFHKWYER